MELMQETDDISCREELEEEEEEITREEESSSKNQHHHHHHYNSPPFSSPSLSLSSSPSTTNHHQHHAINNIPHHQQQIPWFNMNIHDHHQNSPESHNSSSGLGLKQLDFMELSLGNNKDDASTSGVGVDPNAFTSSSANQQAIEKEHMFDKVVTPSDVGKLNRLVIPKQYAEKYFPLDSTTNEKGLLLNFEDRNGKLWRFRYSYWNSSQSYVMTKGWSRFVKEKKLDAGDIVSFQRGVGELYRHRLYIDWRRRSNHHQYHHHQYHDPSTTLFTPFILPNPNQPPHYSMIRWGATSAATPATTARLYSTSPHTPRHYNYHMYHPFNQQQNHGGIGASGSGGNHSQYNYNEQLSSSSSSAAAGYYMRSAATSMPIFSDVQRQQQEGRGVGGGANISLSPMIIDSVPVAHHHNHYHHHHQQQQQQQQQQQYGGNKSGSTSNTAAKRLRLFGVNMECGSSTNEEDDKANSIPSSSSLQPHQHEDNLSVSQSTTRFGDQREEAASMLFDLDPSLQYRQ